MFQKQYFIMIFYLLNFVFWKHTYAYETTILKIPFTGILILESFKIIKDNSGIEKKNIGCKKKNVRMHQKIP